MGIGSTAGTNQGFCIPRDCKFDTAIVTIACGASHSAFITQEGQVFTMGQNNHGQLGNGNS